MAVKNVEQSNEERQQEERNVKSKAAAVTDDFLSSLGLSDEEEKKETEDTDEGVKVERKKLPEPEAEETEDEESEDEDEEEDLVPKSKVEKRIKSEIEKRKVLEARLRELEEKASKPTDSRTEKLERMTTDELKILKRQTRQEFKRTDDPAREQELLDLEDEIDSVIVNGPKRFEEKQQRAYQKAAAKIKADNDDFDFTDEAVAEIQKIAAGIYTKYPSLKNLAEGQATALELAFDHYKTTSKISQVKSKEGSLKREVTKLKRKTSLDTGSAKGPTNFKDLKKLGEKARASKSLYDKEAYFKEIVDVDQYLPAEHRRK